MKRINIILFLVFLVNMFAFVFISIFLYPIMDNKDIVSFLIQTKSVSLIRDTFFCKAVLGIPIILAYPWARDRKVSGYFIVILNAVFLLIEFWNSFMILFMDLYKYSNVPFAVSPLDTDVPFQIFYWFSVWFWVYMSLVVSEILFRLKIYEKFGQRLVR